MKTPTRSTEAADAYTGHLRFNIRLLAERLVAATRWVMSHAEAQQLPVGFRSTWGRDYEDSISRRQRRLLPPRGLAAEDLIRQFKLNPQNYAC